LPVHLQGFVPAACPPSIGSTIPVMRDAAAAFDGRLRTGLSRTDIVQLEELLARLLDNVS
jgi:hypothetical protein